MDNFGIFRGLDMTEKIVVLTEAIMLGKQMVHLGGRKKIRKYCYPIDAVSLMRMSSRLSGSSNAQNIMRIYKSALSPKTAGDEWIKKEETAKTIEKNIKGISEELLMLQMFSGVSFIDIGNNSGDGDDLDPLSLLREKASEMIEGAVSIAVIPPILQTRNLPADVLARMMKAVSEDILGQAEKYKATNIVIASITDDKDTVANFIFKNMPSIATQPANPDSKRNLYIATTDNEAYHNAPKH